MGFFCASENRKNPKIPPIYDGIVFVFAQSIITQFFNEFKSVFFLCFFVFGEESRKHHLFITGMWCSAVISGQGTARSLRTSDEVSA